MAFSNEYGIVYKPFIKTKKRNAKKEISFKKVIYRMQKNKRFEATIHLQDSPELKKNNKHFK